MTRRSDVAVFLASLRLGGAERLAVELSGGLAAAGLNTDLVVARGGGPLTTEVSSDVRIVDLGAWRTSAALPALIAYLRRERPRVLVPHVTHACLVALAAARLSSLRAARRTPVVVVEASTLRRIVLQSDLARDRLLPPLARRLYPSAAAVVAWGRGVGDDIAALCPDVAGRIQILPATIVGPRVLRGAAADADDEWFAPGAPPVVLAVARLVPEKDLTTLMAAFALVRRARLTRLLVIGEGPQRARLETLAAELGLVSGTDVRLAGADPNPYRFMARAGAVVLSSRVEGLPAVLVEALALGAPVVSTDCPSGPREILDGGRFGRLVPVGDAAALAAAIDDVLDQRPAPAPAEAWAGWEVEHAAAAYHDLLRTVWLDDAATSRHSRS